MEIWLEVWARTYHLTWRLEYGSELQTKRMSPGTRINFLFISNIDVDACPEQGFVLTDLWNWPFYACANSKTIVDDRLACSVILSWIKASAETINVTQTYLIRVELACWNTHTQRKGVTGFISSFWIFSFYSHPMGHTKSSLLLPDSESKVGQKSHWTQRLAIKPLLKGTLGHEIKKHRTFPPSSVELIH